jgi:hypothetical protein
MIGPILVILLGFAVGVALLVSGGAGPKNGAAA